MRRSPRCYLLTSMRTIRTRRLVSPRLHRLSAHLAKPQRGGTREAQGCLAGRRAGSSWGRPLAHHNIRQHAHTRRRGGRVPATARLAERRHYGPGRQCGLARAEQAPRGIPPAVTERIPVYSGAEATEEAIPEVPHGLLSTSLLACKLEFDLSVSHVFVLEPPRSSANLLYCPRLTALAGGSRRVVVFLEGRRALRG
ncbi:hypothetical protein V8E53_007528 [Lactarius tabidus]